MNPNRINLKSNIEKILNSKIYMSKYQRALFKKFLNPNSRIHNDTIINELKTLRNRTVTMNTQAKLTLFDKIELANSKISYGGQKFTLKDDLGNPIIQQDGTELTGYALTFYKIIRSLSQFLKTNLRIGDDIICTFNINNMIIKNIRNPKKNLSILNLKNVSDKITESISNGRYVGLFSNKRKIRERSLGNLVVSILDELFYGNLIKKTIEKRIKASKYELVYIGDDMTPAFGKALISSISFIDSIDLIFTINRKQKLENIPKMQQYFRRGDINCVIKGIMEQCENFRDNYNNLEKLKKEYENKGVSYEDLHMIAQKLSVNIRILDVDLNVKYQVINKSGKWKTVNLINNEFNHVETCKNSLFSNESTKLFTEKTKEEIKDILENPGNEYYNMVKIVKNDEHLIFNDMVFTTKEYAETSKKIREFFDKNLTNNMQVSTNNIELFELSHISVHYPSIYTNQKCEISENNLIAFDKNKAFASYRSNILYNKFMFPNGLDGVYVNTNKISADKIISLNGISEIKNIIYSNVEEPLYTHFKNINFIENMTVYPNNYLYYLWSKGVRFTITRCAISYNKKDIEYTEENIKDSIYKQVYGILQMSQLNKVYHIEGSEESLNVIASDLQQSEQYEVLKGSTILYNKEKENKIIDDILEDKIIEIDDLEFGIEPNNKKIDKSQLNDKLVINKKMEYASNQSYISSYIIGYSLIETLSKLENIPYNEIKAIRCDEIITDKKYKYLFDIDENDISKWKIKDVTKLPYDSNTLLTSRMFMNPNEDLYVKQEPYLLTEEKLKYSTINLITGAAGSGKSKRFLRTYDNNGIISDERIKNCFYLLPSHDLVSDFKEENKSNECLTYQRFITNGFSESDYFKHLLKYNNVIIDEASFINTKETTKIINMCKGYGLNVFFISDIDKNRAFQLKPVEGKLTTLDFYKTYPELYHIHLDKVKRCNGELLERLNKIRDNNLTNEEILKLFSDRIVNHSVVNKNYKPDLENIIICPINEDVSRHNITMYNKYNTVIQKDPDTVSGSLIKNKRRIVDKKDFAYSDEIMDDPNAYLGYAITAHLSQGKTYKKDVYIIYNRMYCDNLFYVMLSRATDINKIHIVTKLSK